MFELPEEVLDGIAGYEESLEGFLSGRTTSARFKGIRVPWGVYSQRKGEERDEYMARIRFPGGFATGEQLRAIAEATRRFGDGMPHLTTRQDIQIHFVKIGDTPKLMDYLKDYDLSPRGGGGNTVRNIMSCPYAGICSSEEFDVRGYAAALTEYMLKDPISFNLPRKFKIAFSGCPTDCGYATVNDAGFIAKKKREGGKEILGFRVYAAGGMGGSPRVATLLEDFIPAEDAGLVAEALKRVFNQHGNRKDKHKARMRFLIRGIGEDEFKRLYQEELRKVKEEGVPLRKQDFDYVEDSEEAEPTGDKGFDLFRRYNVVKQRQKGRYLVELRILLGYMTADKLEEVASLDSEFPGIDFAVTQKQNLLIRNVKSADLLKLYEKLKGLDLASPYASTILDVVCCAGASTCNLGLCDSKEMSYELVKILDSAGLEPEKLEGFNIKINGCPNSCGHHPIGFIGMNGTTRRFEGKMVPFYRILLGGRVEEGKTQLNTEVGIAPARAVPKLLKEFLTLSQEKTGSYEDAYDYLEKEGRELMAGLIEKYSVVPPYDKDKTFYRDWGKTEDFSLAGIGAGECGAGVMDIIESDVADSEKSLTEGEADPEKLRVSIHLSARALLVVRGIDAKTPEEAFEGFLKEFVEAGYCSPKFKDVQDVYVSLGKSPSQKERKTALDYARELLEDVRETRRLMDNSFNFQKRY